jgi:hypothetical protein
LVYTTFRQAFFTPNHLWPYPLAARAVKKETKKPGPRPKGKISIQLRVLKSTHEELDRVASLDNKTLSEVAEEALLRYFKARARR